MKKPDLARQNIKIIVRLSQNTSAAKDHLRAFCVENKNTNQVRAKPKQHIDFHARQAMETFGKHSGANGLAYQVSQIHMKFESYHRYLQFRISHGHRVTFSVLEVNKVALVVRS